MTNKNSIWLALFAALAAAEIVGEASGNDMLVYCTKPLLMPVLAAWFFYETRGSRRFLRSAVMTALALSTAGDVLLMLAHGAAGDLLFLLGLAAFLMAHLFYAGGFLLRARRRKLYLLSHPWWVLPFAAYSVALLGWLWPGINPGLRGPVGAYAAVISLMAACAINLLPLMPRRYFSRLMLGALLFILSDSLIAVNRFGHSFELARVAIMLTYLLGQLLMVSALRLPAAYVPNARKAEEGVA